MNQATLDRLCTGAKEPPFVDFDKPFNQQSSEAKAALERLLPKKD